MGGHGLTLVMHLLREKQSFQKFLDMLTTDYSMLCDGINCLEPFHTALANVSWSLFFCIFHDTECLPLGERLSRRWLNLDHLLAFHVFDQLMH